MHPKLLPAALLLLAACGPSAPDRARADALHMLRHERGLAAGLVPDSLRVFEFTRAQVSYFSSDVPTFGDGHLVTYPRPAAGPGRAAVYVASNDSAFFFLPIRHQAEFERQYKVKAPAPVAQ